MRIQITSPHTATTLTPAAFAAGETVALLHEDTQFPGWHRCCASDGRVAWIHSDFLHMEDARAVLSRNYSSVELSVAPGAVGEVIESLGGWHWVRMADGRLGWVPAAVATPV